LITIHASEGLLCLPISVTDSLGVDVSAMVQ